MSGSVQARAAASLLALFALVAGCGQVATSDDSSDAGDGTEPGRDPGATGGAPASGGSHSSPDPGGGATLGGKPNATAGAGAAANGGKSATFGGGDDSNSEGGVFAAAAVGAGGEPMAVGEPGPCDLYAEAGTPCVAAYSTVRRLRRDYAGPLYQIRTNSNATNTGTGGQLHDIGTTDRGFADAQAQDALCEGTICTIARIYDQSGKGNDLPVAPAGIPAGGELADTADFESIADAGPLSVDGHPVYSLFMEPRQGYRSPTHGNGVPKRQEEQGIYMLADGTHAGSGCCWNFGNADANPRSYAEPTALLLGKDTWGAGGGDGPWFMYATGVGVWAGGSKFGDPGWGSLNDPVVPNPANPSLPVPFALGFLKTKKSEYALRMANVATADTPTTAYRGAPFKSTGLGGAIVLGIGSMNENRSFGTFYEGAVVAGYPSDEVEQAVLLNVRAAGYGKRAP